MAEQFSNQGGASDSDPSALKRWLTSSIMTRLADPERVAQRRHRAERQRVKTNAPHQVEYFHQLNEGYSHLAVQLIEQLVSRYDITVNCHLVTSQPSANNPEPERLQTLSFRDSELIAAGYGLNWPIQSKPLSEDVVETIARCLTPLDGPTFAQTAVALETLAYGGEFTAFSEHATGLPQSSQADAEQRIATGCQRRRELGHYSGAMFFYGGEWYWGVDRLIHLEQRLQDLGLQRVDDTTPSTGLIAPRPDIAEGPLRDSQQLTLEVYPSLRSPYTALIFDRVCDFADTMGLQLSIRPVLPMVMRGVPATRQKGTYIFTDAAREARLQGLPYGRCYDPIGQPVRNAYALYPWAEAQGRARQLLSQFFKAAFVDGLNLMRERNLRRVVERAGLQWTQAKMHLNDRDWEPLFEANRLEMYQHDLWGVPTLRLLSAEGNPLCAVWGQDRLWVIAAAVQRELSRQQAVSA